MHLSIVKTVFVSLIFGIFASVHGQTPDAAVKPSYYAGDVESLRAGSIVITTKAGPKEILLTERTAFKRASAEDFNLATAAAGALKDISVGDKVTVSALLAADGKAMNARTVYFVAKADIEAKNTRINEDWRKRGIKGRVTVVNPQANQVTVEMRSLTSSTNLVLMPKDKAKFLRYAQDSIRYDEAAKSSLADVKVGDEIRALGDRNADGTSFAAEEVITGAFQTIAGTVKSVDPAKNEVVIKNLQTGKDVTVSVTEASVVKRFPAEQAERMAGFTTGGAGGVRPGGQRVTPPAGGQAQSSSGRGGPAGARGGIDDMLERFPNITTAELKAGDMIAVSSTKNTTMDRVRAIKLLAGVEPFLRMAQAPTGGQRGQSVQGGFTIPGLDGVGF